MDDGKATVNGTSSTVCFVPCAPFRGRFAAGVAARVHARGLNNNVGVL
ncbi:MAG: hypothetical protein AB1607_01315 [Chloroflexota bacterium]